MSNAYTPVRIWPYPYFFRSTPSERQTVARVDTEGAGDCVPVGECSGEGAVDIADLVAGLLMGGSFYVKVAAPVWVDSAISRTGLPWINLRSRMLYIIHSPDIIFRSPLGRKRAMAS